MNKLVSLLTLVSLTLSTIVPLRAQQQTQPADDIVRIFTNLVQIDAVVTDREGSLLDPLLRQLSFGWV